jgi:AmmeMemoRadiSam system protein B
MNSRRLLLATGAAALAVGCFISVLFVQGRDVVRTLPRFPSYFMQPAFVDDAFAAAGSVSFRNDVGMVLMNHHLLASNLIARVMKSIATADPLTVVLISPDHFAAGIAPVTSVIAQWPTPYGVIEPAIDDIRSLSAEHVVNLQESPFAREHGITNITMFIRKAMPRAKLLPIIIRDDAPRGSVDTLARAILALPGPVVIVGSFDFTHNATDVLARGNDAHSKLLLERGDPDSADGIVVDSKPGIRLLMTLARLRGLTFSVSDMTNSAQILHDPSRTDVTSYITGTWAPAREVVH